MSIERSHFRGVPVDNLRYDQALTRIEYFLELEKSAKHLITLSLPLYLQARQNDELLQMLNRADLVIPESAGLQFVSYIGYPRLVRTAGVTLAEHMMVLAEEKGYSVMLFGSSIVNRERAQKTILTQHQNLKISYIPEEYDFQNETDSLFVQETLNTQSPDIAIMAGNEGDAQLWIDRWIRDQVSIGLIGNFGRTIDYWSGDRHDPRVMRKYGLEWLFRSLFDVPERRKAKISYIISLFLLTAKDVSNDLQNRKS